MPRSVARPKLERKAGVAGAAFLLSLCLTARLVREVEVCDTRLEEEEEDEVEDDTAVSVFIMVPFAFYYIFSFSVAGNSEKEKSRIYAVNQESEP